MLPDADGGGGQFHGNLGAVLAESGHLQSLVERGAFPRLEVVADAARVRGPKGGRDDQFGEGAPARFGERVAEGPLGRRVPLDDALLVINRDDAVQRVLHDAPLARLAGPQLPLGLLALGELAVQLQAGDDLARERLQRARLLRRQGTRHTVNDAQRPQRMAVFGHEARARIEPDVRLSRDERVVGEPRIGLGIGDREHAGPVDRVRAERLVTGSLVGVESHLRLEPLPVRVDQADEGDGRPADVGGEAGEIIKIGFCGGIQYLIIAQSLEPGVFVIGQRGLHRVSAFQRQ